MRRLTRIFSLAGARDRTLAAYRDILAKAFLTGRRPLIYSAAKWGRKLLRRIEQKASGRGERIIHPLFVRIAHWINAFAAIVLLISGMRIYNASPLYPFLFPPEITLGGWLAGALAWHFAAMWLLVANGLAYLLYGVFSGHFARRLLNVGAIASRHGFKRAIRRPLIHGTGEYNLVQRLLYVVAIGDVVLLVLSGLALWKPVQFQDLSEFLGGYEAARHIHFYGMAVLAAFLFAHVAMAFIVKDAVKSMFTGRLTMDRPERLRGG
ncbi:cytochrome b/b6 domain-containing protein [Methylocystis sp. S23]